MKYKYNGQWVDVTLNALEGMPIGSIIQFAGSVIPTGWLICDGSSLSEEEYPQLYDVIGHTYGGSGLSFNLPNFKGRVPVGQDTSDTDFDTLGETGGEKTHTLTVQELPSHNHWGIYNESLTSERLGGWGSGSHSGILSEMATNTFDHLRTGNTGEDQPHNNLQPYLVVNYIIKATQTTPTFASVVNATNSSTTDAYSCDYVNKLVDYSTTEIKTGAKWIDGKPIYRKVFDTTLPSATGSAWQSVGTISTNTDTIIKVYGNRTTGANEISDAFVGSEWYSNKTYLYIRTSSSYEINRQKYIVVEYTKTTD